MASSGSDYDGIETSVAERPQKPKVWVGGVGSTSRGPGLRRVTSTVKPIGKIFAGSASLGRKCGALFMIRHSGMPVSD